MKVAHSVVITPGRCGLYETTRELVVGLRELGVDSRMVDPTKEKNELYPEGTEDRGAPFADLEWAKQADVLINHSGLGEELEKVDIQIIHIAHGRPRSSFISERDGGTPIYSYHYQKNLDPRFKAVVTFWPEHKSYLEVMFPDKPVRVVQPPVDLQAWTPEGPNGYKFKGKRDEINVVCTDAWRDDVDPFVALNAYALFHRAFPRSKLHIYAVGAKRKGWDALFKRINSGMGEISPWVKGLDNVYRAASVMITPHQIATRSIREAMACGCPVAQVSSPDEWPLLLPKIKADRGLVRKDAEDRFNPKVTALQFNRILEGVA